MLRETDFDMFILTMEQDQYCRLSFATEGTFAWISGVACDYWFGRFVVRVDTFQQNCHLNAWIQYFKIIDPR